MITAKTIAEVRQAVAAARKQGQVIGLVPTMGALHEGHMSLVDAARRQCGFVGVSIFVNPTQFGPDEDLSKYPRPLENDLALCQAHGVDLVFVPEVKEMYSCGGTGFQPVPKGTGYKPVPPQKVAEMYPPGSLTRIHVDRLTEGLCGASRPGHFDGVCTVVAKLFNIFQPDAAYFGQKDYQQAAVIRRMTADLDLPLRIEVCPTVRENDALAMSSRNAYLGREERQQAAALSESLRLAADLVGQGRRAAQELKAAMREHLARRAPLGRIEYIEIVDPDRLTPLQEVEAPAVAALAVKFPSARLIDNMTLRP
jgi:pantoate--beta-alanine ligase